MGPILYGYSRIITRIGVIAFGSPSRWGLALGVQSHTSSDGMTVGFWKTKRMFPKMVGFPPKSSILIGFFHYKPSILGYPYFWKHLNLRRTYAEPTPWLDLRFFCISSCWFWMREVSFPRNMARNILLGPGQDHDVIYPNLSAAPKKNIKVTWIMWIENPANGAEVMVLLGLVA